MGRTFSKEQRVVLEMQAGREGEADHIKPYSLGGASEIENGQIISRRANRLKGSFHFKPRVWQEKFLHEWDDRKLSEPFLLVAAPGSGKTMAALAAAHRWMRSGADRRVVIVVPQCNLQEQWQSEALKFGIELQTTGMGTHATFRDGFQGGVVTYNFVAKNITFLHNLCFSTPTMVIFDEVHHCGDDTSFGNGVSQSFKSARERLLMSGTPWKSDGRGIPYVTYDENAVAVANYTYSHRQALIDGVIRSLVFEKAAGVIENEATGEVDKLSEDTSEAEARKLLRKLLNPSGEYVRQQLIAAERKLRKVRETTPDAGGLAVCADQSDARKVAQVLHEISGQPPSVIVSSEEYSNDTIEAFKRSDSKWLVAVKKVSEGTDIKRLQVLAYLTNTATELFFRQVIGRVCRVRGGKGDSEGFVFTPADPRITGFIENLLLEQLQAKREIEEREEQEAASREFSEQQADPYNTRHAGVDIAYIGEEKVAPDHYARVRHLAEESGNSMEEAKRLLEIIDGFSGSVGEPISVPQKSMEKRMRELKTQLKSRVAQICHLTGREHKDVHVQLNKQCGNKRQDRMTESDLAAKLNLANAIAKEAKIAKRN